MLSPEEASRLCDRNFGVGGDGVRASAGGCYGPAFLAGGGSHARGQVIFALPSDNGSTDYQMRIYNCDGSEPEMCGNGIRCLARFVADRDGGGACQHRVHTLAGASVQVLRGRQRGRGLQVLTRSLSDACRSHTAGYPGGRPGLCGHGRACSGGREGAYHPAADPGTRRCPPLPASLSGATAVNARFCRWWRRGAQSCAARWQYQAASG